MDVVQNKVGLSAQQVYRILVSEEFFRYLEEEHGRGRHAVGSKGWIFGYFLDEEILRKHKEG